MRLILDHHYPAAIAQRLRVQALFAAALSERGWQVLDDEVVLDACQVEGLTLVTNNVADFTVVVRRWQVQGRSHSGLIFTSDRRWPRTRQGSGALGAALARLLGDQHGDWVDRIHWL